jgi:hypothetical protein
VLLGALSGLIDIDPDIWTGVIRQRVPAKAMELNVRAFWQGRESLGGARLGEELAQEAAA